MTCMRRGFVLTILLLTFGRSSDALPQLTIVSFGSGPMASVGSEITVSIITVALETFSVQYPQVFHNYTWVAKSGPEGDCSPKGADITVTKVLEVLETGILRQSESTPIIIAGVCLSLPLVADIARELDVFTFSTIATDDLANNRRRFPTLLPVQTSPTENSRAIVALMSLYEWTFITVIQDMVSKSPYSGRVSQQCAPHIATLRSATPRIQSVVIKVDSSERRDWVAALNKAFAFSRIVLICTTNEELRVALFTAARNNLTDGNHVFIATYHSQVPYDRPFFWPSSDGLPKELLNTAFECVFFIRTKQIEWDHLTSTTSRILEKRKELYGFPIDPENQYNEFGLPTYEAIEMIAKVLVDWQNVSRISGVELRSAFTNRTFELSTRSRAFTKEGLPVPSIVLQKFSSQKDGPLNLAVFDTQLNAFIFNPPCSWDTVWDGVRPPDDRPACGFQGEKCVPKSELWSILGVCLPALVTIGALWWKFTLLKRELNSWWNLAPDSFVQWKTMEYSGTGTKSIQFTISTI